MSRRTERLADALHGVGTVVCESQYRQADQELATRNRHMTATQAAALASRAGVGRLVLFHLSDRYRAEQWREMLAEAGAVFPATSFPPRWDDANGLGPEDANRAVVRIEPNGNAEQ